MTTTTATSHAPACADHDDATSTCLTSTRAAGPALMWASTRPGQAPELHLAVVDDGRPWTVAEWDALLDAMRALRSDAVA